MGLSPPEYMVYAHGPWLPTDDFAAQDLRQLCAPAPILELKLIERERGLTDDPTLPYGAFDALRARRSFELTGLDLSMLS